MAKANFFSRAQENRLTFLTADTTPRVLLLFLAVMLQLIGVSGVGFTLNGPGYWLAGTVLWLLWFFLMFLVVTPHTDTLLLPYRRWLQKGAAIIFIAVLIIGIGEAIIMGIFASGFVNGETRNSYTKEMEQMYEGFRYNDGTALSQQAADNILQGKNPYANSNIVEAMIEFNGSYDRVTPLRLGRFANVFPYPSEQQVQQLWNSALKNPSHPPQELESHVCYPAGSFLLVAPFIEAGVKNIRIVYSIFVIAGLIYAVWRIPGRRRLLFIGVCLISLELWNTLAVGETGIMLFPLLLVAWITFGENNWISAIFMGLAVASKQIAWFFLPFYLILLWRTSKPKTVALTLGIIAGLFIVTNAYFIARDPALWLQSVTSPMVEPMFPVGVGVISLVTSGFIHVQTSLPFTAMELIVFIGAIVWYARNCKRFPDAGLLLAILPLFFAWRSLWTYFFYITVITMGRMLIKNESELPALVPENSY